MILKLDLEKAFDRIEWGFIRNILHLFKFPDSFIRIAMHCISSTSISVLLNGGKLDCFFPSRGIRQGDPPFHPYLFILCIGAPLSSNRARDHVGKVEKCEAD